MLAPPLFSSTSKVVSEALGIPGVPPRFDPAELGRVLASLTPHELRQAEGLVAEARE